MTVDYITSVAQIWFLLTAEIKTKNSHHGCFKLLLDQVQEWVHPLSRRPGSSTLWAEPQPGSTRGGRESFGGAVKQVNTSSPALMGVNIQDRGHTCWWSLHPVPFWLWLLGGTEPSTRLSDGPVLDCSCLKKATQTRAGHFTRSFNGSVKLQGHSDPTPQLFGSV